MSLGPLYVFLGEMSVQVLCPFFNWVVCLPGVESCEFFRDYSLYFCEHLQNPWETSVVYSGVLCQSCLKLLRAIHRGFPSTLHTTRRVATSTHCAHVPTLTGGSTPCWGRPPVLFPMLLPYPLPASDSWKEFMLCPHNKNTGEHKEEKSQAKQNSRSIDPCPSASIYPGGE